ncbi:undecaprenyl-phosphate glucose phosphotransferase [uncultured Alsobacter sp.]|uniref:undecaprenyl-phosphate glucose phosphotransferase n=1 Tax=uncultured Alsobacter sp. TaxID=1748258 RepID=UPI0025E13644|nr:undecaprenyl-phosphate glucose phosphotransferase [uncultured Alsobacter sp.]
MAKISAADVMRLEPQATGGSPHRLTPLAEEVASRPYRPSVSLAVVSGLTAMAEALVIVLAGLIARTMQLQDGILPGLNYAIALSAMSVATIVAFQALGTYDLAALRSPVRQWFRLAGAWSFIFLVALVVAFLARVDNYVSPRWLAAWYLSVGLFLFASRAVVAIVIRRMVRAGRLDRRTAVVGGGPSAEAFLRALDAEPDSEVRVCGVFDDRDDTRSPDMVGGYPKLGTTDDLVEFVRRTHVDLVVFTLPITAEDRILQMLRKLWVLPVDIRLAAHQSKLRLRPRSYSYIGSVPVLPVTDRPIADWDVVLKAAFDRIVGAFILLLASPVMLLTALAVKLDSKGPVFFKQKRYGFNNELIEVYKFRSMYTDMTDHTAAKLATKNDPRVTRVGRIIRKTSLDELPQLINVVFKGNLSLVGPRPHAVNASAANKRYDDAVDGYFARHKVKPGITGWAQVNGWRGETDTLEKIQRRVEHDLYYIENWSVFFDLYILAVTPFALTKTENAY